MKKIIFICKGNVARSQMAEAYYNIFTKSKNASSAGTLDYTPEKYGTPIKEVVQVMEEEKISLADHFVKTVTEEMVNNNNHIFVLCKKEECPDFLKNSKKVIYWNVKDPFETDLNNFRRIRDLIKDKVISII